MFALSLLTKYPYWYNIPSVIHNYLPLTLQAINIVKIKLVGGGGGGKVATKFSEKISIIDNL